MRLAVVLHRDHAMGPSEDVGSVTVPVVGLGYTGPAPTSLVDLIWFDEMFLDCALSRGF